MNKKNGVWRQDSWDVIEDEISRGIESEKKRLERVVHKSAAEMCSKAISRRMFSR